MSGPNVGGPSQTDGQPIRETGEQVGGKGADGNFHIFATDNSGNLSVAVSGGVVTTAPQNAPAPANEQVTGGVFNATALTLTSGNASQFQVDSAGALFIDNEGRKASYRMSVEGFVPVASATGPLFSIQGSASKIVRLRRVRITWACGTGQVGSNTIRLQKFSVLTGGTTGNTPTAASNDTNNPAATAVALQYSTVPTTATVIGGKTAAEEMMWITGSATAFSIYPPIDWTFGDLSEQSLVLRGVAEYFGVVVAAVGTATPLMSIWVEWTEE